MTEHPFELRSYGKRELDAETVTWLKGLRHSNIANILLILGLSATINPLTMGGITTTDLAVVILTSLLLFLTAFTFRRRAVDRWEGVIFLVIYALYIWQLVR